MKKSFFTPKEVAKSLQINILTVYAYMRTGKLNAVRLGRVYRIQDRDFNRFIREHKVTSAL
jgi:excisionase family DNA binding protein